MHRGKVQTDDVPRHLRTKPTTLIKDWRPAETTTPHGSCIRNLSEGKQVGELAKILDVTLLLQRSFVKPATASQRRSYLQTTFVTRIHCQILTSQRLPGPQNILFRVPAGGGVFHCTLPHYNSCGQVESKRHRARLRASETMFKPGIGLFLSRICKLDSARCQIYESSSQAVWQKNTKL